MASVELTYGAASQPLHRALSLASVLWGIAAMAGLTWALAAAAERLARRRRGGRGEAAVAGTASPA